jgi:hypothetical protein
MSPRAGVLDRIGQIGSRDLIRDIILRTGLYGMLFGAGLGGFYAAVLGTFLWLPLVGTVLGFFFGAFAGALLGLPLGLLNGLLLSWLFAIHRDIGPPNPRLVRLQAGLLCIGGTMLTLLIDWALHDLPDPDGFAVFRAYLLGFEVLFPTQYLQSGTPIDLFALSVWVFAPALMSMVASWLTGRRVARWFLDNV